MHTRASNGIIPLGGSAVIRQTRSTSCFGFGTVGVEPEVNGQMLRMEQIITPAVDVNRQFQDAFSSNSQRNLHSIVWEHDLTVFGLVRTSSEGRAKLPIRILDALSLTTACDHSISARDVRMSDCIRGKLPETRTIRPPFLDPPPALAMFQQCRPLIGRVAAKRRAIAE
jgi:hypothetical protein